MATSQNGYLVLDDDTTGSLPRLRVWSIPGVERKFKLRDGSCGFLLAHLTSWFNDRVERIDVGTDDWGYSRRLVSGSDIYSNHASGTAVDLNATQHPMGVPTADTFTATERGKIHKRIKFYDGTIRWGGDYRSRPDAMHFELDQGLFEVQKVARRLAGSLRGKAILRINPGAQAIIFS